MNKLNVCNIKSALKRQVQDWNQCNGMFYYLK